MIKFHEIKKGDYLLADNDGDTRKGEVTDLNSDEKQVCVNTGIQEFWFETNQLMPIALNDQQLVNLKFTKQESIDGSVKYSKGAFRIFFPSSNNFSNMEIWYRDERRHIMHSLSVHQLQNHFHEMTKVLLDDEAYV
jgi:hypothetical protein